MILKDFMDSMNKKMYMEIELRDADNKVICKFTNDSSGFKPYENYIVDSWFSVNNKGTIVVNLGEIADVNVSKDVCTDSEEENMQKKMRIVTLNSVYGLHPDYMLKPEYFLKDDPKNIDFNGMPDYIFSKYSMATSIRRIADHYGYSYISRLLVEEMAELTQALNKYYRYGDEHDGKSTIDGIVEEIADVEICLEELKWLMAEHWGSANAPALTNLKDLNNTVLFNIKTEKIKREEDRIKKELEEERGDNK